jgi:hypothetical protein
VTDRHLFSREVMELPGSPYEKEGFDDYGEIHAHTLVGDDGEVHVFWHDSGRPVYLYLGGYGVSVPDGDEMTRQGSTDRVAIDGGENHSVIAVIRAPSSSLDAEVLEPRDGWLHSHSFGGRGAFPHWQSKAPVRANTPIVAYVNGTRGRRPAVPPVTVEVEAHALVVTFEGRKYAIRVPD